MKKAVIIGSGIAGIASALRLQKKGYAVSVFEADERIGGKLNTIEMDEYRFDMGPSLFTLPHLVDELFTLHNKNPKDYFNYHQHGVSCNYFFTDRTQVSFYFDKIKLKEEIQQKLKVDPLPFLKFLKHTEKMYQLSAPIFLNRSLHKTKNYFKKEVLKALLHLPSLHLNKTMHALAEKKMNHPKLVQIMDRYATYNGSNPYKAPGVLSMIPHLEQNVGTFFPVGGMRAIIDSLIQLGKEKNIEFNTRSPVEEIVIENKKAVGVKVNGATINADVIVSNADIYYTYKNLLPKLKAPKKQLEQERSSSAIIFYWGVKKLFSELDLHNIFFTENYEAEFTAIFDDFTLYEDPTVYIHVSSKLEKKDAPIGSENWFVMVNAPADHGQDWDGLIVKTKNNIIKKINQSLKIDLASLIENESILDPRSIDKKTGSYKGALYGTSSNHKYSAFFRHANFSKDIENLYFCGGSVHPGGGIPLCLMSAKIIDNLCPTV